ncbi:MAG: hypothetical protein ACAH80_05605 [Alphaproteobacteria bacterium]
MRIVLFIAFVTLIALPYPAKAEPPPLTALGFSFKDCGEMKVCEDTFNSYLRKKYPAGTPAKVMEEDILKEREGDWRPLMGIANCKFEDACDQERNAIEAKFPSDTPEGKKAQVTASIEWWHSQFVGSFESYYQISNTDYNFVAKCHADKGGKIVSVEAEFYPDPYWPDGVPLPAKGYIPPILLNVGYGSPEEGLQVPAESIFIQPTEFSGRLQEAFPDGTHQDKLRQTLREQGFVELKRKGDAGSDLPYEARYYTSINSRTYLDWRKNKGAGRCSSWWEVKWFVDEKGIIKSLNGNAMNVCS